MPWKNQSETDIRLIANSSPSRTTIQDDEIIQRSLLGMEGRKAFIPGFKHDIFVSYAHIDDEPLAGSDEGWVTTLVRKLKTRLAQRLGRSDAYSLWMDFELSKGFNIRRSC